MTSLDHPVAGLRRMGPEHAVAVLAFERENRTFFARTILDRGDAFFTDFAAGFAALLEQQAAGDCALHLLLDDDGSVLGRFNLTRIEAGGAALGYRVAERAGGRGLATRGVREVCALASETYGLQELRAAAAHANPASQRVLSKNGFTRSHDADPAELGGATGAWFVRECPRTRGQLGAP